MIFTHKASRAALLVAGVLIVQGLYLQGAQAENSTLTEKINDYIGCLNRLSGRAFDARERYFSWVSPKGPTGKERIIYGTYTIYDTADCKAGVEKANALEPRDADIEAAASAYVTAVVALEPLLKEADDYYTQENYKDDKMAKGKAMHPRLIAAWAAFTTADTNLRDRIDIIQDKMDLEKLAEIEKSEGRKDRYYIQSLMISAKHLMRAQSSEKAKLPKFSDAVSDYEAKTKAAEDYARDNAGNSKMGSMFVSSAKAYLVTAKQLMRRVRDKVPYSSGERMMLNSGGGEWMVEGSPARMLRDYNELVESYNRGANF
jgi:hypothetical protein